MDHLPPEIQKEIFSYLSLEEMVHCRLVSHSFKVLAEERMKHITHLNLEWVGLTSGLSSSEMDESYVQHTFLSKPFVTVTRQYEFLSSPTTGFFAFLGKFCSNLQVLRMDDLNLSYDHLVLLGPNLQFCTCQCLFPGSSERTAASLLRQFPNLKGFKYGNSLDNQYAKSWRRELLQLGRPVCDVDRETASRQETVELLARGAIKCLRLPGSWTGPPFSLPQSLAESLVELSVEFEPTVEFCPFALPNLLYLTVTCEHDDTSHHLSPIVSAPRLRCLTFNGPGSDFTGLSHLKSFVNHFDQLRALSIHIYHDYTRGEKIFLPTGLEKLTFGIMNFELLEYSSPSLTHLVVERGTELSLVCPRLKMLIYEGILLSSDSMPRLLNSLSKCVTLVKLRLVLFSHGHPVPLQPLIDLLPSMTQLTHLELRHLGSYLPPFSHLVLAQSGNDYAAPDDFYDSIDFEENRFPSLVSLDLELLKIKITFHLTSSFTVSTDIWGQPGVNNSLTLKAPNKEYSAKGIRVECRQTNNQTS